MTRDDIIRMARKAEWTGIYSHWVSPTERKHLTVPVTIEQIERFAQLVADAEREACATVCDKLLANPNTGGGWSDATIECSVQIRARNNQ